MSKSTVPPPEEAARPSEPFRTVASLLLCIHLFCISLAVWANFSPSPLLYDVLDRLRAYTTLLNFNLNYTPYHLTHGTVEDVDDRIEVLPQGKDAAQAEQWIALPDVGWRGSDRYKRYQRLAEVMSYYAQDEERSARLASSVAEHFLSVANIQPAQIRSRKHLLLTMQDYAAAGEPDPDGPQQWLTPYAANVVISGDEVEVIAVSEQGEVALPAN